MSRGLLHAWMWQQKINRDAVPRLTFDIPITRYTEKADAEWRDAIDNHPRQDRHWSDQKVRRAIWGMAGEVFTRHRHQSSTVRGEARTCLALLHRVWAAHAAGRKDLVRAEFAGAREAWLSHSNEIKTAALVAQFKLNWARSGGGRTIAEAAKLRKDRIVLIANALLKEGKPRRGIAQRIQTNWKQHGWRRADGKAPAERTINEHLKASGI